MKRLLLRIGALGIIVVLGLIAIAQAQRGTEKASVAGESGEAPPKPVLAPSDAAGNPLRIPNARPASSAEGPPVTAMAGDEPAGTPISVGKPVSGPTFDPFSARTVPGTPAADDVAAETVTAGDMPMETAVAGDASGDPAPPPTLPARTVPKDTRYSNATPPPRPAPATGDRYMNPPSEAADPGEPATLRADPRATPARSARPAGTPSNGAANELPSLGAPGGIAPPRRLDPPAAAGDDIPAAPEGVGRPGDKRLEGPQAPQLTIHKSAPPEIQVGKPATFRVIVRNTGTVAASGVEIHDQIPKGTRVIDTKPKSSRGVQGELVFALGAIKPGEESTIEVQLMPLTEGEIGSVATVTFAAEATARTVATKPQLTLESSAPDRVLIGEEIAFGITISNPGSGVATGVILEERIPDGLQHPAGAELEYAVGDLKPGESRKLDLKMVARQAGAVVNVLSARADGNLRVEEKRKLEIISPRLDVALEGPKKRYLEREATYQLSVSNPGTAPAERVELVAYLPTGLKFVSANNGGQYEEANRAVHWRLEELPINETGSVELVTLPIEAGQQAIKFEGSASRGQRVEKEQPVVIEGITAVMFQVSDTVDPVEVNGETTYEVRVVNQGSKAASNVQVVVNLPAEMKAVAAEGPTRYNIEGTRVVFDGLARLAPKAETIYRLRVKALQPGDLRTRIQLMTDEMSTPVTKEESTRVFADE